MLAFTLVEKCLPMIIGSHSGCLKLHGMTACLVATNSRTFSGVNRGASSAGDSSLINFSLPKASTSVLRCWRQRFSRVATYAISGVTMPARAAAN